jgi:hydroxyacylglutathione hydrolase
MEENNFLKFIITTVLRLKLLVYIVKKYEFLKTMLHVKTFEFNPLQENTFLLYDDEKNCAIIDPGCYFENEQEQLISFIQQNKLKPTLLINTHCHLDHVFGNKFIAETYNLTLHLHKDEVKVLEFAPTSGLMYGVPFDNYKGEYNFIDEKQTLKIGNEELTILFTPGHSPASLSFYNAKNGFIISGDVLFKNSIGRADLPGGNYETLIKTVQTQLFTLPENTIVYSGHGPATTIGTEKRNNPFFN